VQCGQKLRQLSQIIVSLNPCYTLIKRHFEAFFHGFRTMSHPMFLLCGIQDVVELCIILWSFPPACGRSSSRLSSNIANSMTSRFHSSSQPQTLGSRITTDDQGLIERITAEPAANHAFAGAGLHQSRSCSKSDFVPGLFQACGMTFLMT
jgi:hypothetical protein